MEDIVCDGCGQIKSLHGSSLESIKSYLLDGFEEDDRKRLKNATVDEILDDDSAWFCELCR